MAGLHRLSRIFTLAVLSLTACSEPAPSSGPAGGDSARHSSPEDFVQSEDTTPLEKQCLEVGRKFMLALAARRHDEAFALLAKTGLPKTSLNQFDPPDNDAAFEKNQNELFVCTPEAFADGLQKVTARYGEPAAPLDLHVFSSEPNILAGKAVEKLDRVEILFAIGNMPDAVPASDRRASLRGQMRVKWKPEDLAQAAKESGLSAAEIENDPESGPYYNLKLVIVEEDGALKVGYFEFLPPSLLD